MTKMLPDLLVAGIDIGGTNIKSLVLSGSGNVLDAEEIPTSAERGMQAVIEDLRQLILGLHARHTALVGLGIGFPAVVDNRRTLVHVPPNMPGWEVCDLRSILMQQCSLPISIDNDANVAALAELHGVADSDPQSFFYLTLGTGVGGAIVLDSRLFHGERGGAGEIGHLIISSDGHIDDYGADDARTFRKGVLERYTGRDAIIRRAKRLMADDKDSALWKWESELDVEHIALAADQTDATALQCFSEIAELLGVGIASALNLLDLRRVVIGGGVARAFSHIEPTLLRTLQLRCLPSIADDVRVEKARHVERSGALGAAVLALQNYSM